MQEHKIIGIFTIIFLTNEYVLTTVNPSVSWILHLPTIFPSLMFRLCYIRCKLRIKLSIYV